MENNSKYIYSFFFLTLQVVSNIIEAQNMFWIICKHRKVTPLELIIYMCVFFIGLSNIADSGTYNSSRKSSISTSITEYRIYLSGLTYKFFKVEF
jgi:hypothetical protein